MVRKIMGKGSDEETSETKKHPIDKGNTVGEEEEELVESSDGLAMSAEELRQETNIKNVIKESFLQELLMDEYVTDISFNGVECFIQHNKKGRYAAENQPSEDEVSRLIKRIAAVMDYEFNDTNPILDTEVTGLRINAVHKTVSPFGVTMALRVSKPYMAIQNLDTLANAHVSKLLDVLLQADTNMIISGQTGSGKTELQKLLVGFIPMSKKISLLEDTMDSHCATRLATSA